MPVQKVYCEKCGSMVERLFPSQRIWHGKCPKRGGTIKPAPEFLPRPDDGSER